ncbi:hypothetical protein E1B28_013690 [Marasmius oreades]|uniref:Uncharacterized protein n=1 Tax=Marasmius oreades TaxID=181124 RepID=A0A9P7RQA9_9AGAR|nr:uncharacterized protein E1B28_013690 [Marasmius oreades]KAG7087749.1 hypothetical protein E1B28_013690 [Marasmius oreades]
MLYLYFIYILALASSAIVQASPTPELIPIPHLSNALQQRTTPPQFPDTPPSCPICQKDYDKINNCAQAAPVLANFSMIIFNPGAFINVIQCSCTETFQSVFPQCVDCFIRTNQTDVLQAPSLPDVLQGMQKICALSSSLLGGVASANGEIPSSTTSSAPTPTSNGVRRTSPNLSVIVTTMVVLCGIFDALLQG